MKIFAIVRFPCGAEIRLDENLHWSGDEPWADCANHYVKEGHLANDRHIYRELPPVNWAREVAEHYDGVVTYTNPELERESIQGRLY